MRPAKPPKCDAMPPDYQPWSGYDAEHEAYEALVRAICAYAGIREAQGHRMTAIKQDLKKIADHFDERTQEPAEPV